MHSKQDHIEIVPLVSFPKSGNTWLRFLLANVFKKDRSLAVDYSTVNQVMPTSNTDDLLSAKEFLKDGSPVFVKHHYNFSQMPYDDFEKAIYIYRNGFDALYSYWHFVNAQNPGLYPDITAFSRCYWRYCGHWGDHIESWQARDLHCNVLAVSYEDLLTDTKGTLGRCCTFLGFDPSDAELSEAVESSSSQNMKQMANSSTFMKSKNENFNFVRSAKRGDGEDKLPEWCKEKFISHTANFRQMKDKKYLGIETVYSDIEKRDGTALSDKLRSQVYRFSYHARKALKV